MTISMYGRLTPQQHQPYQSADVIAGASIFYEPDGLQLSLSALAPNTMYDIFGATIAGVDTLVAFPTPFGTSSGGGGSLPSGSLITTGTGSVAWLRAAAAFDGVTAKTAANGAWSYPSNSGMANFLGQAYASAVQMSGVTLYSPTDDSFRGDESTIALEVDWSDDGATWHTTYSGTISDAYAGSQLVQAITITEANAHVYWRVGFGGNGTNAVKVGQIVFAAAAGSGGGPVDRGLIWSGANRVNDAAIASVPAALAQGAGEYLGSIKTDATTATITAHVTPGLNRVFNYWNARNRADIELVVVDTSGPTGGRFFYQPASFGAPGPTYPIAPNARPGLNAAIVVGLAEAGNQAHADLWQSVYLNASGANGQYWAGIVMSITNGALNAYGNAISGTMTSLTIDDVGPQLGEDPTMSCSTGLFYGPCEFVPYEGCHGNISAFYNPENQGMTVRWRA